MFINVFDWCAPSLLWPHCGPLKQDSLVLPNAKPFYDDQSRKRSTSPKKNSRKRLLKQRARLAEYIEFIEGKVFVEVCLRDLHHEEREVVSSSSRE